MAGLTIHLASTDAEFSVPLRDALAAEGLPFAQDPANETLLLVSVVADDPWNRAVQLRAANVARIFVLCTGHIDPPPAIGVDGIVVRHWADAETAAMFVHQAYTHATQELASVAPPLGVPPAMAEIPPPPAPVASQTYVPPPPLTAGPPPAAMMPPPAMEPPGPEPEFLDEGALMSAEEPEVIDDAQLMEPGLSAPPPQPARFAAPVVEEVTPEDAEFVQRVFNQVRDVDFRSPPPPPPRKALAGLDKKMQFLRDKVRELERDLARVGFIWSVKQRQVNLVEQVVAAKETERATAVQRYNQIKEQGTRAAAAARIESDTLHGKLNDLEATKNGIEGQLNKLRKESTETIASLSARLAKEEQEKTNLVAEFRSKMEAAQIAFTQLRDDATARIADLESRLKATEEKLAATEQARADAVQTIAARDQTVAEQVATIAERDQTIQRLNDEMAGLRADLEAQTTALKNEMETRVRDLTQAHETETTGLNQAKETQIRELTQAHETETAALRQAMAAKTDELTQTLETEKTNAAARLAQVEEKLNGTQADLHASLATTAERDRTITEISDGAAQTRAEVEAKEQELAAIKTSRQGIQDRLVEREKTLSAISDQMSREGGEHQERVAELKLAIKGKDERLQVLEKEVASARAEFAQLADEFAKHRDEAGRISEELGQACADARAEARTSKDRIAELEHEVREWEARLTDAQAQLVATQEDARIAHADVTALGDQLAQANAQLQAYAAATPQPAPATQTTEVTAVGLPPEPPPAAQPREVTAVGLPPEPPAADPNAPKVVSGTGSPFTGSGSST